MGILGLNQVYSESYGELPFPDKFILVYTLAYKYRKKHVSAFDRFFFCLFFTVRSNLAQPRPYQRPQSMARDQKSQRMVNRINEAKPIPNH